MRSHLLASLLLLPTTLTAQAHNPARVIRDSAIALDATGKGTDARIIWQKLIDEAATPAAKAQAQRRMAMSWGFEGDCANAMKYHNMVIDYWKTREFDEPQNAFYQQGEMANESGRVCLDIGELDVAHQLYQLGSELGNKEPEPRTHPKSLWDFRLAHAEARIDARRGKKAEAEKHVAEARRALDSDPAMAQNQERYFPILVGYVALYTGDLATAARKFDEALAIDENNDDAYITYLLGVTHEKMGHVDAAIEYYEKAYKGVQGSHNPPAALIRREVGKKARP